MTPRPASPFDATILSAGASVLSAEAPALTAAIIRFGPVPATVARLSEKYGAEAAALAVARVAAARMVEHAPGTRAQLEAELGEPVADEPPRPDGAGKTAADDLARRRRPPTPKGPEPQRGPAPDGPQGDADGPQGDDPDADSPDADSPDADGPKGDGPTDALDAALAAIRHANDARSGVGPERQPPDDRGADMADPAPIYDALAPVASRLLADANLDMGAVPDRRGSLLADPVAAITRHGPVFARRIDGLDRVEDIVLALDTSGSMRSHGHAPVAAAATRAIIDAASRTGARLTILGFHGTTAPIPECHGIRAMTAAVLRDWIRYRAAGNTAPTSLLPYLRAAPRRTVMLIITDGDFTADESTALAAAATASGIRPAIFAINGCPSFRRRYGNGSPARRSSAACAIGLLPYLDAGHAAFAAPTTLDPAALADGFAAMLRAAIYGAALR